MCVFVWSDEVDEIEVYGSEAQSGTLLTTYSFEVMKNSNIKFFSFFCGVLQRAISGKFFSVAGL